MAFSHLSGRKQWTYCHLFLIRMGDLGYFMTWLDAEHAFWRMTMQGFKGLIVLSAAIVAVVLGACRREEAAPMKLGAEVPAAAHVAR